MLQVIQIGREEITRTTEEAAKRATAPLQAEVARQTARADGYRKAWQDADARLVVVAVAAAIAGPLLGGGLMTLIR